jgi:glucose/arabinose dehydrogenase
MLYLPIVEQYCSKTRIERYNYNSGTQLLESPVTILQDIPGSNDHNSARIAIGPDLKLYYSVGDMGAGQYDNLTRPNNAQNLNIYEGKILRLNTELMVDRGYLQIILLQMEDSPCCFSLVIAIHRVLFGGM